MTFHPPPGTKAALVPWAWGSDRPLLCQRTKSRLWVLERPPAQAPRHPGSACCPTDPRSVLAALLLCPHPSRDQATPSLQAALHIVLSRDLSAGTTPSPAQNTSVPPSQDKLLGTRAAPWHTPQPREPPPPRVSPGNSVKTPSSASVPTTSSSEWNAVVTACPCSPRTQQDWSPPPCFLYPPSEPAHQPPTRPRNQNFILHSRSSLSLQLQTSRPWLCPPPTASASMGALPGPPAHRPVPPTPTSAPEFCPACNPLADWHGQYYSGSIWGAQGGSGVPGTGHKPPPPKASSGL